MLRRRRHMKDGRSPVAGRLDDNREWPCCDGRRGDALDLDEDAVDVFEYDGLPAQEIDDPVPRSATGGVGASLLAEVDVAGRGRGDLHDEQRRRVAEDVVVG